MREQIVSGGAEVNVTIEQTWKDRLANLHRVRLPPISIAAIAGRKDLVLMLVEAGADVDLPDSHYSGSALLFAAYHGHADVVATLLEHGADINYTACAEGQKGVCALHEAAVCKQTNVVQLLLEKGADLTIVNEHDMTPLHEAAKPADVWAEQLKNPNSEEEAANARKKQAAKAHKVVKAMLDSLKGQSAALAGLVEMKDQWGFTPLIYALLAGYKPTVVLLLKAGANPRIRAKSGAKKKAGVGEANASSALSWAVGSGTLEVVEHMLSKTTAKLDVNHPGENGRSKSP